MLIRVATTRTDRTTVKRHPDRAAASLDVQLDTVMRASRVLVGVVTRSMAEIDGVVSLLQFRTLVIIAASGRMNLSEVADQLGVHPSNATRVVDKLVSGKYVDRRDDPQDRRYLALSATARGRALVEQVMDHRRSALAGIVQAMPAARRRDLVTGLQSFADVAGENAGVGEGLIAPPPA